jgi:hypothetical protein
VRVLVIGVILALASPASAQGILARTRMHPPPSAPEPAPPAPSSTTNSSSSSNTWDGVSDSDAGLWGYLAAVGLGTVLATSPLWGPAGIVGDNFDTPAYFPGYPHAVARAGYLVVGPSQDEFEAGTFLDPEYLKSWGLRAAVEDGHDFGSLNRIGTRIDFDTTCRLGASMHWDYYHDHLGDHLSDETTLGDAHLTVRIAQADWIQMHAGLGGRWRFDEHTVNGGASFLYSADVFLWNPVILSSEVDLGNLDRQFIVRSRTSLGAHLGHCELLAGYDFLRLGSVNLQGPFAGVRLWF